MSDVNIVVRTADQTRKAEVTIPRESAASEVIQGAVDNWNLPADTDYSVTNVSKNKVLPPSQTLTEDAVSDGDILEVQPVLVAGI